MATPCERKLDSLYSVMNKILTELQKLNKSIGS